MDTKICTVNRAKAIPNKIFIIGSLSDHLILTVQLHICQNNACTVEPVRFKNVIDVSTELSIGRSAIA